ncbi:helix-hairpin-helix domain-containing protein [Marixanthomonas sp. SCSIO 43207]|uniref:ComEA family DNA-binding protein n=1 Tax=Marixanthomonas sp. SCSIO 43207 TaxID=2779360 RepID=UPI001CA97343|nr:helix-hairpin-helix domain-containing protein [Marixanthomonas sp. SCSIO 43207]UAB80140.1 helix-hairpin-helix domain-containing protein [Marixanthomonas sp. SCSIO 43207]
MNSLKSHFAFNRSQRSGILLLSLFILILFGIYHFVDFSETSSFDTSSPEIVAIQQELESITKAELENKKPKIFPFNPNFITDYKAYTLGLSTEEYDRLKNFRSKDKWINSVVDFKRVTQVSDSVLAQISPYFKFPDWVTNPKPKKKSFSNFTAEKPYAQKIDLNTATKEQLQRVSGIGEAYSDRIVKYRSKLGGFTDDVQLYNVYGLDTAVVKRALKQFTVKTPREIEKMNINTASASDIATIPSISFELAKKIWEFRKLRERLENITELQKLEGLSQSKLQLIQLYLYAE